MHLTPIEFRLLACLAQHPGMVLTHRQLLQRGVGAVARRAQPHYLRIYMKQLRDKLEADPARPRYLLTETGVGYRLVADGPSSARDPDFTHLVPSSITRLGGRLR